MGGIDEGLEFGIGAKMRIDAGEISHPIAVIACAFLARAALHRFVFEHRRKPDRGDAHALNVIEPLGQPLQVAAMIEALVRRIEAVIEWPATDAAAIIGFIPVFESVGKHEIDDFIFEQAVTDGRERRLCWGDWPFGHGGACAKRSNESHENSRHNPSPFVKGFAIMRKVLQIFVALLGGSAK